MRTKSNLFGLVNYVPQDGGMELIGLLLFFPGSELVNPLRIRELFKNAKLCGLRCWCTRGLP